MIVKWSIKLVLIISFFIESSLAMCLSRKGGIDPSCVCRSKKNCMKIYNKEVKRNAQQASKIMSKKKIKKLYGYAIPSMKKADEMFSGSSKIVWNKKEYDELKKSSSKLERLNKKLAKRVESAWKKKGIKKYKFSDRQKLLSKSFKRHIPENVMNYVEKKGYPFSKFQKSLFKNFTGGSMLGAAGKSDGQVEGPKGKEITGSLRNVLASGVDENGKKLTPEEVSRLRTAQAAQVALSRKKYKVNDIHPKHVDLFKIVSSRYYRSLEKLGRNELERVMTSRERENSLASAFDLVDLLN